ncbi:hypothetical protein DN752_20930 [Echinicola strongylocentroti]|uniref:XRE family transcriptional regulator n=1 Tax=Echinicola strongylocentroti TaxID=1795355 RepID=A0A2Z4INQ1_9BACT|nr:helix-turn-helix transcriptional regulator [Echinicola strongylocentroti]AWW32407.1 hypothetical protein DN752_20930 [Echinicola strongylocentroti]
MNRIKEIIKEKGYEEVRPNEEILTKLGIKINTWTKWVEKRQDPSLTQLPVIADFLQVSVGELIQEPNPVKS